MSPFRDMEETVRGRGVGVHQEARSLRCQLNIRVSSFEEWSELEIYR